MRLWSIRDARGIAIALLASLFLAMGALSICNREGCAQTLGDCVDNTWTNRNGTNKKSKATQVCDLRNGVNCVDGTCVAAPPAPPGCGGCIKWTPDLAMNKMVGTCSNHEPKTCWYCLEDMTFPVLYIVCAQGTSFSDDACLVACMTCPVFRARAVEPGTRECI